MNPISGLAPLLPCAAGFALLWSVPVLAQMESQSECPRPRNSLGAIVIIGPRAGGDFTDSYYRRLACSYSKVVIDRTDQRENRRYIPYPDTASEIERETGATGVSDLMERSTTGPEAERESARRELFKLQAEARTKKLNEAEDQNKKEANDTLDRVRAMLRQSKAVDIFIAAHTNEYFEFLDQLTEPERSKIRLVYNSGCTDFGDRKDWLSRGAKIYVAHEANMSCSPGFLRGFLDSWLNGESLSRAVADGNRWLAAHLGPLRYIGDPLGITCSILADKYYQSQADYLRAARGKIAKAPGAPPTNSICISSIPPNTLAHTEEEGSLSRGRAGPTASDRRGPAEKVETGSHGSDLSRPNPGTKSPGSASPAF